MKKALKIILPIAVIGAGLGVKNFLVSTAPVVSSVEPEEYALRVETIRPTLEDITLSVSAFGEVQPNHLVTAMAEVRGVVQELGPNMRVGSFVKKGELLFQLDTTDYDLAMTAAYADFRKAEAALQLEQAQAELAIQDWKSVGKGDAPALAKHEPQLAAALAGVDAAKAKISLLKRDWYRCRVTAPMDARVQERRVAPGQWVAPGTPLAVLLGTKTAQVVVPIPLNDLAHLPLKVEGAVGLPVALTAEIGGATAYWQGEVTRTKTALDPSSRTLQAIVTVKNPYSRRVHGKENNPQALVPGMFVQASFRGTKTEKVIRLPRRVLMSGNRIPIVDAENRLRAVSVEVVQRTQDTVIVSSGLGAEARICITPLATFVDGMKVVPSEAKQ